MALRLHKSIWNSENTLVESLITEAVNIHGVDFMYIPRTLVGKDDLLGEDRLSKFKDAYPIVMYMENAEGGFQGQGAFASKFGLTMEQSATLTVARKTWKTAIGDYGQTILPERPAEGDLLYFPMTGGLFEIMFVQHQDAFYQLGQLYVYKLTVELFRYSSESMETGIAAIDNFEVVNSTQVEINTPDEPKSYGGNTKFKQKASEFVWSSDNPFGEV
jgi:Virus neck protein